MAPNSPGSWLGQQPWCPRRRGWCAGRNSRRQRSLSRGGGGRHRWCRWPLNVWCRNSISVVSVVQLLQLQRDFLWEQHFICGSDTENTQPQCCLARTATSQQREQRRATTQLAARHIRRWPAVCSKQLRASSTTHTTEAPRVKVCGAEQRRGGSQFGKAFVGCFRSFSTQRNSRRRSV